jgi:hypothetical protein
VPPPARSRRAGARTGKLTQAVGAALREEVARLELVDDAVVRVTAVGDAFAALDAELERLALVRLAAVHELRRLGWSYDRIARETGLSKGRVAQLCRDPRLPQAARGRVVR